MGKKSIIFMIGLIVIVFISIYTYGLERWAAEVGIDIGGSGADVVHYWLPVLIVGLLLRNHKNGS